MTDHAHHRSSSPGRRWFKAGAIVLIIFGAFHQLVVYKSLLVGHETPAEARLTQNLKSFQVPGPMGPFKPTAWHTTNILSNSYSLLLIFAGVINLLTLTPVIAAHKLRPLTLANVIFTFLIAAICLAFQFPPPLLFAGAAWFCFTMSLIRQISAQPTGILAGSSVYPEERPR